MQDLSYMSALGETEFEAERCRLIRAEIMKAPEERRKQLLNLQMQLDLVRDKVSSEEFMLHCASMITENLENMVDQAARLKSLVQPPPPVKPVAER